MFAGRRVLLIDPDGSRRGVLARRLRAQGFALDEASDPAVGADLALSAPPCAVVADLWMPSISGVQLSRLLRSEPATMDVPVILCGDDDAPRNRFWAEQAGAAAYVLKGRTSQLVHALRKAIPDGAASDDFFVQLGGGGDIRDRIARHLDEALFESVIASELRSLAGAGNFERLFDRLAQFMSQITAYRWLALATPGPMPRLAIHHHPVLGDRALAEAREAFGLSDGGSIARIEDEDAIGTEIGPHAVTSDVTFAGATVARVAIGPGEDPEPSPTELVRLLGRELGGAVRMVEMVEESQRLAEIDPLTGVMNRRAFGGFMSHEIARADRYGDTLGLALLDVDHFKHVNDTHGHAGGDRVLAAIGELLPRLIREVDRAARWGGEEFVVAYTGLEPLSSLVPADRLRAEIERLVIHGDDGERIRVTASIGIAERRPAESLDSLVARADAAMYASKAAGRNRVTLAPAAPPPGGELIEGHGPRRLPAAS